MYKLLRYAYILQPCEPVRRKILRYIARDIQNSKALKNLPKSFFCVCMMFFKKSQTRHQSIPPSVIYPCRRKILQHTAALRANRGTPFNRSPRKFSVAQYNYSFFFFRSSRTTVKIYTYLPIPSLSNTR